MALVPISMLSKINDAIAAALKRKLDANGVRNDATTTDAGYVLDARMGKTLGDRAEKLELKVGDLYFDTDSSGRWGYKSSKNGAVTPFRNPTGSAAAADVLSGKTFSSATAENIAGSMPDNGAWTGKTTGKGNVTIPAGYHSGQGYVSGEGAYTTGMSDADARVNENSASYQSGKEAGSAPFLIKLTGAVTGGSLTAVLRIKPATKTVEIVEQSGSYKRSGTAKAYGCYNCNTGEVDDRYADWSCDGSISISKLEAYE